jgi:hypothetical protein
MIGVIYNCISIFGSLEKLLFERFLFAVYVTFGPTGLRSHKP